MYPKLIPGTFNPADNKSNDYYIDRGAQRSFSYTGIKTFPLQDIAMMEDQRGPLMDRTKEHLASSDAAIIQVRRRLIGAARALASGGLCLPCGAPRGRCRHPGRTGSGGGRGARDAESGQASMRWSAKSDYVRWTHAP